LLYIAGIDEAGRGALAGPVAAAAVVLPHNPTLVDRLDGVRDSKQMRPEAREYWKEIIEREAVGWAVGYASAAEIDEMGIAPATRLAATRALAQLSPAPQHLLIDYIRLPESDLLQTSLPKGDARCLSIACASVLAKVGRDALLHQMEDKYPGYGFAGHKGYGTTAHRAAIQKLGPCAIHRRTFTLLPLEEEEV
jgi:ribonuclease HII